MILHNLQTIQKKVRQGKDSEFGTQELKSVVKECFFKSYLKELVILNRKQTSMTQNAAGKL